MEIDILNTLDWRLQFISTYDILTHFFCQGILFTNDKIKSMNNGMRSTRIDPKNYQYHADTIKHNAEVFTEKCLKKHEFLEYDRLSLACGIIMSARKAQNLQELWPNELVAMTGNRLHYPKIKYIMKHICEFFSDQISCSITNSACSSPVKSQSSPYTVQKTVKRAQIDMISNRKQMKEYRRETSQEQTTSKKLPTSVVTINRNGVVVREGPG